MHQLHKHGGEVQFSDSNWDFADTDWLQQPSLGHLSIKTATPPESRQSSLPVVAFLLSVTVNMLFNAAMLNILSQDKTHFWSHLQAAIRGSQVFGISFFIPKVINQVSLEEVNGN